MLINVTIYRTVSFYEPVGSNQRKCFLACSLAQRPL